MFEGFEENTIPGEGADIFVRSAGSGPPLLLLHGYPQTGAMWAGIAPRLAERFSVVVPDLRGYGRSSAPPNTPDNLAYSKRTMGRDVAAVMTALGHPRFHVAGHDRGGRVAYRMALDMPERIDRLAVLDIVPVVEVWERMDAAAAMKVYHWLFFAQPAPIPETLIGGDPVLFLEHTIASWTKAKTLEGFDAAALDEYHRAFARPAYVAASCNDYRAGATIDWQLDREDRDAGRRIAAPTLVLWGAAGIPGEGHDPLDVWGPWCDRLEGHAIDAGHFIAEEAPEATLRSLLAFFRA
ncbi:alpha/beta fold hydrolase [Aurantimonas sp. HBX-1]|uniref:alpha/beta fold hydrolase n=1 Tax=Aurantimonas sp. HBX-1 TaxID=2906072 RepID=UPI001F2FDC83|nr:alpha/beta hydrolase [Aurantimonas sp. HBX-1]UIJ71944.1 alpha/beta hydrolase [Aurantimonas sp. HBX-1]